MEISTRQAVKSRPAIGKIVMAVAFASVMGSMCMTPALGRDDDRGRHEARDDRDRHGDRDRRGDRDWHGDRGRYGYRPEYRHPYRFAQPVYVPPPVYYPPPPSPGVSLFFPLEIRIR
jgi:Ni/Co efflux regulator RcnB